MPVTHIVIIGASFGGRMLASKLVKAAGSSIEITLVDKSEHFEFICTSYKYLYDSSKFESLTHDMKKSMESLGENVNFK